MNKIKMEFKKLIIVGVEREYRCTFESGLNLIWAILIQVNLVFLTLSILL